MQTRNIAMALAKGLVAGAAGTAAMTGLQMLEMKLTKREPSSAPADAAEKVLGVEPHGPEQENVINNAVHWGYGTAWGTGRGLLGIAGLRGVTAGLAFFGGVWGAALAMLPSLGVAPKPTEWGTRELALDALRHGVYAGAATAVYELLDARS